MAKTLILILLCCCSGLSTKLSALSLGTNIDALKKQIESNPGNDNEWQACLTQADNILTKPIIRRVNTLEDFSKLDGKWARKTAPHDRAKMMTNKANAKMFAMASCDVGNSNLIFNELPLLAAAYRLTRDDKYLDYIKRQLEEIVSWDELQRQGWTLRPESVNNFKPRDGVWLATGHTIAGISLMLDILPETSINGELKLKLDELFKRELKLAVSDWTAAVPWYVRSKKIESNQWIVPASGILLASLYLGKNNYPEAYNLAKNALKQSLDAMGEEGAASEGIGYAIEWTIPSLALAAYFMDKYHDSEFTNHPFLKNYPKWLSTAYQPGENVMNAFDWWVSQRGNYRLFASKIAVLTVLSNDPVLQWVLFNYHKQVPRDVFGMLALGMDAKRMQEPPLFGAYKRGALAIWRSSFQPDADGVWVRGFHPNDFHSHGDSGHVNYIKNGKIVLLEAGTGGYSDPRQKTEYSPFSGHNVLQVNDTNGTIVKKNVPIIIETLNNAGGKIQLNSGSVYPEINSWLRTVQWDTKQLEINDKIDTKNNLPQQLLLRWHLGSENNAQLESANNGMSWKIFIPAGKITLPAWHGEWFIEGFNKPQGSEIIETAAITIEMSSNIPITVTQKKYIDHTFKFRARYHEHTLLEVKPAQPTGNWTVTTSVQAK
jgi:hypothetical protein